MKSDVQFLCKWLGPQAVLLPVNKCTKIPSGKWGNLTVAHMTDPKHLAKLNCAANIGVALGDASNGLCSIDIDLDEMIEPFLQLNPFLKDTLCSKGARGCNFWVRITGECPRTFTFKANGKPAGEFRSTGGYTVIYGIHPDGMDYKILKESPPIEVGYESIKWFEEKEQTHPPLTSSLSLNSKYSILHPVSSILYNNTTSNSLTPIERIKTRKTTETWFKRRYPNLVDIYASLIEGRLRAIEGARNAFLVEAVPFLYRAVAPQFIQPLVKHFYLCNQWLFKDSLEQHLRETQALVDGAADTYLTELSEGERVIYSELNDREKNLLRICRDLALREGKGPQAFYVPLTKFGHRLGLAGLQVQRDIQTLIGYGLLELVEKGQQWKEGTRAKAGQYRYLGFEGLPN